MSAAGRSVSRAQSGSQSGSEAAGELPWRDWILLPVLALFTVVLLLIAINRTASRLYTESKTTTLGCLVLNDPSTGVRGIPNSVCNQKIFESEPAEYRFNNCGHRAGMPCGPKPPDTYRIVLVGSSYNYGMWVPREKSYAALLPLQLTQLTGHKVELYNEAMQWGFPPSTVLRFHQVFDAQPDMILWVLTPYDVGKAFELMPYSPPPAMPGQRNPTPLERVKQTFAQNSFPTALSMVWTRAVVSPWNKQVDALRWQPVGILLEHMLYANQSLYLKSNLMEPDSDGGYLRSQPSPLWQQNLKEFDKQAAQVESQARAAGIPFVAVLVPERAQAAMISDGQWPAGYDPFKLNNDLRTIITSHGGAYFDVLEGFRQIPGSERHFFPVDGHPDSSGHALLASLLARGLVAGPVPALNLNSPHTQQRSAILARVSN